MKRIPLLLLLGLLTTVFVAGCVQVEVENDKDHASTKVIILTEGNNETITSGGYYSISGELKDGQITVDTKEKVYIEFAGVEITNSSGPALQITDAKEITVILKTGTVNTLSDGGNSEYNAAIFSNDTLIIEGDGKLVVTGNNGHGIESDDDVIINGGDITLAAKTDGIHANDNITINSGRISVTDAYEGIESKGDIIINGGLITAVCSDDGFNAGTDITINDGQIYARATRGDAVDSNGTIHINGGTIVAIGGNQPEGGIDCDRNEFVITGGILVATGGANSMPTEASSTQCSALLGGAFTNTPLCIMEDDGETLVFEAEQGYQSMVFSSPRLEKGKTYTILTGGTISGGSEFYGLYSGAVYSGGEESATFTIESIVTMQGGNVGNMGDRGGRMNRPVDPGDMPNMPERRNPPDFTDPNKPTD